MIIFEDGTIINHSFDYMNDDKGKIYMAKKQEEIIQDMGKLNQINTITTVRPFNKSVRIQQCFENCPTLTEQHTAHLSDINYLMEKYKPDELAQYIAARNNMRSEIIGHDFSKEPNFQEAKNEVYYLKKAYQQLPEEIKNQFKNHVEFLKFIDNPANQEKMIKLGLMTKKEIEANTTPPMTTTTSEAKDTKE